MNNANETLTAGEIETLINQVDRFIAANPTATTFEVTAFWQATQAHLLAWRGAE